MIRYCRYAFNVFIHRPINRYRRMLYPRPRRALFLHIQKTAGTSIIAMARSHYGLDNLISHGDYTTLSREECGKKDFISGHFGFEYAEPFMDGRYCFTFLRNPIERILSLYNFYLQQAPSFSKPAAIAHRRPFEDFLREISDDISLRSRVWNNQVWQLSYGYGSNQPKGFIEESTPEHLLTKALSNLEAFNYVGLTEYFDEDCKQIFSDLCIPAVKKLRKTNQSKKSVSSERLPESTISLLESFTELDRKLYDHVLQTRQEKIG